MRFSNALVGMSDLLNADGVLCVLSAAVADQVGAVDPVDEFCLCLEPLHGPCKPTTQQPRRKEAVDYSVSFFTIFAVAV